MAFHNMFYGSEVRPCFRACCCTPSHSVLFACPCACVCVQVTRVKCECGHVSQNEPQEFLDVLV